MRRFQIPSTPISTNKTIRFPNDVVDQIEETIVGRDCTFSAFVIAAVRFALDNMDTSESNGNGEETP